MLSSWRFTGAWGQADWEAGRDHLKVALVCTQGGHLTETLQVWEAFAGCEVFFVTHFSARDAEVRALAPAYFCPNIGQRPLVFLHTLVWSLRILLREQPQVIFSTGSEIALPFFFWGKVLGIHTIFLESWCRVYAPSRTGRLAYPLVDEFWVQWPQLLAACGPKARYYGGVL
jgi:UDP-N-acetylglucosamine:LPS N-acetylglucosamine transferase